MEESNTAKKAFMINSESLGTQIVILIVGPEQKKFSVHKKLLTDRSDYFAKAFGSGFKEARDGIMYLPEDSPNTFDMLVTYIYQGSMPQFVNIGPPDARSEYTQMIDALYALFFLVEKLCMREFQNMVMDKVQDVEFEYQGIPSIESIRQIYQNTHEKSKLRTYAILMKLHKHAMLADRKKQEGDIEIAQFSKLIEEMPDIGADFIKLQWKFASRFRDVGNVADAQLRNDKDGFGRCFLHIHDEGEVRHLED